jgi:hypothetical protein
VFVGRGYICAKPGRFVGGRVLNRIELEFGSWLLSFSFEQKKSLSPLSLAKHR